MINDVSADLVDVLRRRAAADGNRTALIFLGDDDAEIELTYGGLDRAARAIAVALADSGAGHGDRALLMYPPGPDYVTAFLGCLYAGVVAVPVYPPDQTHGAATVMGILADSEAAVVMVSAAGLRSAGLPIGQIPALGSAGLLSTDDVISAAQAGDRCDFEPPPRPPIAFLQYTSGSTAAPKGVMVGHDNLMHNAAKVARALHLTEDTRSVSWLPPYHDMGLIGGILQPIYTGFPGVQMSPAAFLRRPARWLREISDRGATASLAPAFGYAHCTQRVTDAELAELDLSRWRLAMVGSETVRQGVLDAFTERFGSAGFRRGSFYPCYGLAEATLFVTGHWLPDPPPRADGRPDVSSVSCGRVEGPDDVLIVDPDSRVPCPPGVTGEVWITGPTVAHGYWRPADGNQAFQARLSTGDARPFLRTGDLGYLRGEELFLAGRAKEVLIVRGRNHYPQDIEAAAEAAHRSLRARRGAAFAIEGELADRVVLVHEVTPTTASSQAEVVAAIRAAVVRAHGIDLDDIVLVRRGSVPRTTSGKTRRLATRDRYADDAFGPVLATWPKAETGTQAVAAAADAGRQAFGSGIVAAAARVLGRNPLDLDRARPLVAHGLDSVRAVELRFVLAQEVGLDLALPDLLGDASIEELSALAKEGAGARDAITPAETSEGAVVMRASHGQVRLWLEDQRGNSEMQRIGAGVRLFGALDQNALRTAFGELIRRHESLRTTLDVDEDGVVWQTVHPWQPPELQLIDLRVPERDRPEAISTCYRDVLATPFDLRSGAPLRAALVVLAADESALLMTAHHVAVDGWALRLLWHELAVLYAALSSGEKASLPQPPQYRQVAAIGEADITRARERIEFWRAQLAGSSAPGFPADRRPGKRSFDATSVPFDLPASLRSRLSELAADANTTLFTVLIAGFAALLARVTGQPDVLVGTDASNRDWPGGDAVVGFFTQVLPVRADTTGSPAFRALVLRVRERCLAMLAQQDTQADEILAVLGRPGVDAAAEPLRVKFGLRDYQHPDWAVPGLAVRPVEIPRTQMPHELSLDLYRAQDGELSGWISFATDLFSRESVERVIAGYLQLLRHAAADPQCAADALTIMGPRERELIGGFGGTLADGPAAGSVSELLEATAASRPDSIAISAGEERVTYAELHRHASQLAAYLRELGAGQDRVVGVYLPHSCDAIISMLAIFKAGAVYLPLDAAYPTGYLDFVVGDARPAIIVTREAVLAARPEMRQALSGQNARIICLEACADAIGGQPDDGIFEPARPDALAFVIYTSGSTGVPKGTANTYGGLAGHLRWRSTAYPLTATSRVLHHTALGFDVSVAEICWPLACGARLVIPPVDAVRDPALWRRLVHEEEITDLFFVPSLLRIFLEQPDPGPCALANVHCVGEVLSPALVLSIWRAFPAVTVHNNYGPAETAIEMTSEVVSADFDPEIRVPIGRPIPGVKVYLLDRRFQPVPIGAVGEVCIAGPCLGRGYLYSPDVTSQRFVADPFHLGGRMYRSGDLARWLPDGRLDFVGRADHQVKFHGQRVEPGQIEAVLNTHQNVRTAVVSARVREDGDRILVAYLVPCGELPSASELRAFLRRQVPEYLVPQAFVRLEAIPLNSSGKTNYRVLPMPAADDFGHRPAFQAPATLAERTLASIWSEALNVADIGRNDDFRELGGHSLMAIRIAARIRPAFGVEMCVGDLLDGPSTLAELAGELQRRQLASIRNDELRSILRDIGAL